METYNGWNQKNKDQHFPDVKSLYIPAKIESIHINNDLFPNLEQIQVDPGNQAFYTDGRMLFSADKQELLYCLVCKGERISIPDETREIAAKAFYGTEYQEILFPKKDLRIHSLAFQNSIRSTVDGTQYVTARGWEDLSTAMQLYEKKGFEVNKRLVGQYITDTEIAGKFSIYYDLYRKYRSDYQIADILDSRVSEEMVEKSQKARLDERFSILGLLMEMLGEGFRKAIGQERSLQMTAKALRSVRKMINEAA